MISSETEPSDEMKIFFSRGDWTECKERSIKQRIRSMKLIQSEEQKGKHSPHFKQ